MCVFEFSGTVVWHLPLILECFLPCYFKYFFYSLFSSPGVLFICFSLSGDKEGLEGVGAGRILFHLLGEISGRRFPQRVGFVVKPLWVYFAVLALFPVRFKGIVLRSSEDLVMLLEAAGPSSKVYSPEEFLRCTPVVLSCSIHHSDHCCVLPESVAPEASAPGKDRSGDSVHRELEEGWFP